MDMLPDDRSRTFLGKLSQQAHAITTGGSWASLMPFTVQRNLRWFFWDGILASASDNIILTYLALYLLALGASNAEIGLLSSLSSLVAAVVLLPGAMVTERFGRRKAMVVFFGGGIARLTILLIALVPLFFIDPVAVGVIIMLRVIAVGFGNLALPAWTSLTADIIPLNWRGRYFGTRNLVMGVAAMLTTLLVGQIITWLGSPVGYQVAFGLAFLIGMGATYCYAQLAEPPLETQPAREAGFSAKALYELLRSDRAFLNFVVHSILWNLALNIAGPFFNVYLARQFDADASMIAVTAIAASLASMPGTRIFGVLSDKLGPRRVMLITGFIIPVLPVIWYVMEVWWIAIPINIVGGFLWAGYGLASFNYQLSVTSPELLARYSALFNVAVAISLAAGAAIGAFLAEVFGIPITFLVTTAGRVVAMVVLYQFMRKTSASAGQPAEA